MRRCLVLSAALNSAYKRPQLSVDSLATQQYQVQNQYEGGKLFALRSYVHHSQVRFNIGSQGMSHLCCLDFNGSILYCQYEWCWWNVPLSHLCFYPLQFQFPLLALVPGQGQYSWTFCAVWGMKATCCSVREEGWSEAHSAHTLRMLGSSAREQQVSIKEQITVFVV